jgi:dynein heavy chain
MKEMINKMVAIVRKDLNILQRTLMGALIVIDVHARDVVTELVEKGIKSLNDFEFSKQLRYYW